MRVTTLASGDCATFAPMPVDKLDEPCGACGRTSGDHTLREWSDCLGRVTYEDPYHEIGGNQAARITAEMQRRFNLDKDLLIADHVDVKAAALDGYTGIVRIKVPIVMMDFGMSTPEGVVPVAKVAFSGELEGMTKFGELVHRSSLTAVRAAS